MTTKIPTDADSALHCLGNNQKYIILYNSHIPQLHLTWLPRNINVNEEEYSYTLRHSYGSQVTYVGAKVYMLRQTVEFHLKYLNLVHLSALLNGILVSTWVCVLGNHNATPLCDLLSERDITSVQPFPSGNASADESRICRARKDPLGQGLISLIGIAGNEVPHLTVNLSTHYEATGDRFSNSSIVLVNAELLGQELIWNFWVPFNSDTDHLNVLKVFVQCDRNHVTDFVQPGFDGTPCLEKLYTRSLRAGPIPCSELNEQQTLSTSIDDLAAP